MTSTLRQEIDDKEQTPTKVDIYTLGIYTKHLVLQTVHAGVGIHGEGNILGVGIINSKTIDMEVHPFWGFCMKRWYPLQFTMFA